LDKRIGRKKGSGNSLSRSFLYSRPAGCRLYAVGY
jgi:hypothetical protein